MHLICSFGSKFKIVLAGAKKSNPVLMDGICNYILFITRVSKSKFRQYKCSTTIGPFQAILSHFRHTFTFFKDGGRGYP